MQYKKEMIRVLENLKQEILREERSELESICKEILKATEEHNYLWLCPHLWENSYRGHPDMNVYIAQGWIAQDESFDIYVTYKNGKSVFGGRNFSNESEGLGAEETAERIESLRRYGISIKNLKENFYSALQKPLGKYLAEKKISKRGVKK